MFISRIYLEEWKPVVGFETYYEVSTFGKIRNMDGKILKASGNPYDKVTLCKTGVRKDVHIHVAVCEAFRGARPSPSHEVNHKNGRKKNNRLWNLEWLTHRGNMIHAAATGLLRVAKGRNHYMTKTKGSKNRCSKHHKVISPTGEIFLIKGLSEFCRSHKLPQPVMSALASGKYSRGKASSYKGWKCYHVH
jgi:hypothetical protein